MLELDHTECVGALKCTIDWKDGRQEIIRVKNTVLRAGKVAITKVLAHEENDPFDFYIEKMIFGTNGTTGGVPKFVEETRTGLFGTTLLTKNVIASIDTAAPTAAILTAVVTFDEAVGYDLSEMALKMRNGDLYSMVTFPDLGKTSGMQLTYNWTISIL